MATTTVAQFATELERSAATLLEQLQSAGVSQGVDRRRADRDRQGAAARPPAHARTAPPAASARRSR